MEAIVLAGGLGTRLRAVVPDLPKPMAPVGGRPFLEILLALLARKGFSRVVLSVGFMADTIIRHFGERHAGMSLAFEVESQPLGTGGAVRAALERCSSDHAFVFNGDTYLDIEADDVERIWQARRRQLIVVREVADTSRFGRVDIRQGRITAFREKGLAGAGFINGGCYVLKKDSLADFSAGRAFSLETDYFAPNLQYIEFDSFVTKGHFIDIGVPEDYIRAQTELVGL